MAVIFIAIALLVVANLGAITTYAMTPSVPFDGATPPASPDFMLPERWSALPERVDLADRTPAGQDLKTRSAE